MKTITLTRLAATLGAISQVVAVHWTTQPMYSVPVAPTLAALSALPTFQELDVLTKWTPSEFSQSADFFLHSPLSPRNSKKTKMTYDDRPKVTNFTCLDDF
ncbi:hypothetical protein SPRG_20240 [Saprolegnia parasitica CBS 223.65]|uniref:Uncharacterized protein n=1 Tax=Saprolegnia parasitica (strain CBS 223.65) TaxID=695850 RepID=A0A067CFX3_SAPPC|nr:hypothetical protein SPRG_20240 [Saprolegnia parasitica CBS 223.65]KDO28080.1 hypothetical protein SPRG_20240 [Saprolegnia parasitica CBS 223.65]|eukprot:XP_012201226.1 hypothetical protein SPRG_20240 [Saprolegnia parasitica CBS 223.65]